MVQREISVIQITSFQDQELTVSVTNTSVQHAPMQQKQETLALKDVATLRSVGVNLSMDPAILSIMTVGHGLSCYYLKVDTI